MLCRLCHKPKPFIEAHIIAKCLLKPLMSSTGPIRAISKDVTTHPKRLPTGVYDTSILCADCDNLFSPWEDYTSELLFEKAPTFRETAQAGFYLIPEYDYEKLKLCILSILWRMSITKRKEYSNVYLGEKYESKIRGMLLSNNPGSSDTFSIGWLQLTDYIGSRAALGTHPAKHNGVTVYNVGLPGFVAVVKMGQDHKQHPFQPVIMAPDRPLVFGLKEHRLEDDWKPAFLQLWNRYQEKRRRL